MGTSFPRGLQYGNVSIPLWKFNSSCAWDVATYADLTLSFVGVLYNGIIFLLPFFFSQLYNRQGAFLASLAIGNFLCSVYYVYVDIRLLVAEEVTTGEKGMIYALILFLAYHVLLHLYILSWDQYRTIFRFNSHMRFATTTRLAKIGFIVWIGSVVLAIVEAVFLNNLSGFPVTEDVSQLRFVCMILLLIFFWFLPLVFMICWNGDLFCYLLKVIQNGYEIQEPVVEEFKPELMPELAPCPWVEQGVPKEAEDGSSYAEEDEEPELATLPDDVPFEFARCFAHIVVTTLFATPLFIWLTYHILGILRTGGFIEGWDFYPLIYNCNIFICLYFFAKLIPILNPLCYFYCWKEIRKVITSAMPWRVSEEQLEH